MADFGIVSKPSNFWSIFLYLALIAAIGKEALASEKYNETKSLDVGVISGKVYEINTQILKTQNERTDQSEGEVRVNVREISYSGTKNQESAESFNISKGKHYKSKKNLRAVKFRQRRDAENFRNVDHTLLNDTSGIRERSPSVTSFGVANIEGPGHSPIEELAFRDYAGNTDVITEDFSDTRENANNLPSEDQVKVSDVSSNDAVSENDFESKYPDYHWTLSSIVLDNSRVSSDIEPFDSNKDPSLDEKTEISSNRNKDSDDSPSDNQLIPTQDDVFDDMQPYFPQVNHIENSDWIFNDQENRSNDDGRQGIIDFAQPDAFSDVLLNPAPTQTSDTPSQTDQQCQIATTAPPVDECGYEEKPREPGVHLVSLRWREVGIYFTITAFVIFAGFGKLVFHKMHWLSSRVPESCLLIVLGVLMGLLVHFAGGTDSSDKCKSAVSFPTFSSQVFFMVLLPPIILEAAYSLHDRCFIDNLGTVLVFAVVGTLMNVFLVGFSLWGLAVSGGMGDITITLTESLVFSSLISAVDPVAVLSIFQELGVNKGLYFLVFGESLLNDGVTVVVYNMFSSFMEMPTIKAADYALSVVVFFVVVAGGTLIGIVFGVITALFTKYTDTVRVVEPLALLGLAYLAYITAEIFHFSGIISLIVTGLVQAQYAYPNISQKSYTTVKYFIKMASATSDTIIFMFLGMVLVHDRHVWQTGFVLWTLVLCLVIRLIVTLILGVVTNRHRLHPIGFAEQIILAYGGLRGAVAFSLVSMMPGTFEHKELFITATLVVIIFTVFVQGITVGPMVTFLNVALSSTGPQQLLQEVNVKVVDTMMAGIEEVIGRVGDNKVRESLKSFNDKYFMKWLTIPSNEDKLTKLFEKIAITEHYANLYGPNILIERAKEELTASRQDLALGLSPYGSHFSVANFAESEPEIPSRSSLGASLRVLGGSLRRYPSRKSSMAVSVAESRTSDRSYTREEDAKILIKAINNNAFNKLHYTYNKNLVDEDNQDMSSHMHWRREHAERLALLAQLASARPESPGGHPPEHGHGTVDHLLPYQLELLARESSVTSSVTPYFGCAVGVGPSDQRHVQKLVVRETDIAEGVSLLADTRNLDAIMNYHRRHNIKKRSLRHNKGGDSTHETDNPKPNSDPGPGDTVLNIKDDDKP